MRQKDIEFDRFRESWNLKLAEKEKEFESYKTSTIREKETVVVTKTDDRQV